MRLDRLIGAGIYSIAIQLRNLERFIVASAEETQASVDQLTASVAALVAAEANRPTSLAPGQIAIDQSALDTIQAGVAAAIPPIDAVTAADVAAATPPAPPAV